MTTATASFSWANTSSAQLNTWITGVQNLLTAAGLVRAADTGQADPTVTPLVFNGNASPFGYQMWKFPDALQATTPIYIRLDFTNPWQGSGAYPPSVGVSVASSTNGAGTLTTVAGPIYAPTVGASATSAAYTSPLNSYACYVDGTFAMVLGKAYGSGVSSNHAIASLVVDRKRNTAGVAQAGGYLIEGGTQASTVSSSMHMRGVGGTATVGYVPAMIPDPGAVGSVEGANVNVFRHYAMLPGVSPSLGALTYFGTEIADLAPQTVTILGASHTYLPVGSALTHFSFRPAVGHCAMIRWE